MKKFAAVSGAALLLLLVGLEGAADADHLGTIRNSRRIRREIEIRDYDALRMQRERIDAMEEARRETGRQQRREEVEGELQQAQDAFLDSQEAIRLESRAAMNSPRGFYYRKPGTRTKSLPGSAEEITVGDKVYHYDRGVFFRQDPGTYTVVTAPPGAQVGELPSGHMEVAVDGLNLFYYFGTYFRRDGDGFTVTKPPSGAIVNYLPDGYVTEHSAKGTEYLFGGIRYRPFYQGGAVVYAVQGI